MSVFFHPKSGPTVRLVEYDIVLWGAGGGGPTYGGCGGFTRAYNGYVLAGQVLKILVGTSRNHHSYWRQVRGRWTYPANGGWGLRWGLYRSVSR
jgi:hypothetical protein